MSPGSISQEQLDQVELLLNQRPGNDEKLVDKNNVATFSDHRYTKISQSNWNDLSSEDYYVTINVVSARKSSKDNLLDCAVPEGRITTFAGKSTLVSCRLIGEHDGLSQ